MSSATRFSPIRSQVLEYLRRELEQGRWRGLMPGSDRLARELGISRKTAEAALVGLEREGLLESQGTGRRRRITTQSSANTSRPMRVAVLDYEPVPVMEGYAVEMQHLLVEAGHTVFFTPKTLMELGMQALEEPRDR